jgi:hypothetical protein
LKTGIRPDTAIFSTAYLISAIASQPSAWTKIISFVSRRPLHPSCWRPRHAAAPQRRRQSRETVPNSTAHSEPQLPPASLRIKAAAATSRCSLRHQPGSGVRVRSLGLWGLGFRVQGLGLVHDDRTMFNPNSYIPFQTLHPTRCAINTINPSFIP